MGVRTFPKGISWKINLIARLEFEPAYYNVAAQLVSHYVTIFFLNKSVKLST